MKTTAITTALILCALMSACCGRQTTNDTEVQRLELQMTEPRLTERGENITVRFDAIVAGIEGSHLDYCNCAASLAFADESAEDCYEARTRNRVVPNQCHQYAVLANYDTAIPILDCMIAEMDDARKCLQECPADEHSNIQCPDVGASVEPCEELPGGDSFFEALNACDIPENVQW